MSDYYTPEELAAMPVGTTVTGESAIRGETETMTKVEAEEEFDTVWEWASPGNDPCWSNGDLKAIEGTAVLPESSATTSHPTPTLGELVALRDSVLKERGITPSGPAMDECHAKLCDIDQLIAERMGWDS